nr:hypothetical protein [Tanacetum cinerariifolium]
MTIDQQVALDEALVPQASRLRIRKSKFRLRSDITSKESTLQLVYDVLQLTPIYKAFLVTADVPEIFMQELWATATVHHHSIHFKIDNRKQEILAFLRFLKHSGEIRKLTDVNINKLHQPWRSFAAVINKCLSGKSTGDEDDDYDVDERSNDQDDDDQDNDDQDEGNDNDQDTDNEGDEFVHPKLSVHEEEETKDEERFDPIAKTPENSDDEGNDYASLGLNVGSEEGQDAEDDEDELYRDININLGRDVQMTDVHTTQEYEDTHVTITQVNPDGQQQSLSMSSQFVTSMLNPSPDAGIDSLFETTSQMNVPASTTVASLTLTSLTLPPPTTNFFEVVQTNQFVGAVSSIPDIVQRYLEQRMNEAVKIIKEQVKEQVKVQVSKILPNIKETVNEQLKAEVLTRSSNSSKISYAVAADLSKMELKKILIEKIESNKSIHRSDEQRNIYKALVNAYESDKIILDTYGDIVMSNRRRDDADKDEEPFVGLDLRSKRRREGKEPDAISALKEKETKTTGKSTQGSKSQENTTSESRPAEEPMQTTQDLEAPSHQEFETISDRAKQADSRSYFNELMDTPVDISAFLMNRLKVDTLTPELLAGPTYELMKGSCKSLVELEFFLEEVYKIVEWHNYKHLDWITVRKDDNKLYKFKEGDFKRLCIQYIEDMLLLLVQGKLTNLTVEERFAFNFSLRMFTRSIVIQRRVEDLQLGVESYKKKLNLTKPDTYRSDLKRKEAYTAYSNLRGFIYQNKDKQNRLMRIDELHKFSDGTLNDVRTALDDHLKGIRIKYLLQAIWRKSDKERVAAMIQAIDIQLKTRRIMRSLEKFVGGRLYEGDFRMLQRTI